MKIGCVFMQNVCFLIFRDCLPYAEIKIASVIYSYTVFSSNLLLANTNCKISVFITISGKMICTSKEFRIQCNISLFS